MEFCLLLVIEDMTVQTEDLFNCPLDIVILSHAGAFANIMHTV